MEEPEACRPDAQVWGFQARDKAVPSGEVWKLLERLLPVDLSSEQLLWIAVWPQMVRVSEDSWWVCQRALILLPRSENEEQSACDTPVYPSVAIPPSPCGFAAGMGSAFLWRPAPVECRCCRLSGKIEPLLF